MSEAKTKKEKTEDPTRCGSGAACAPVLLDGAMGTLLQNAGMPLGARPEVFGMEHPELVEGIHRQYLDAGSRVLYANAFGANARKLRGSGHTTPEVVAANVAAARRAVDAWSAGQDGTVASRGEGRQTGTDAPDSERVRVALDAGPTGELMEPLGTLSFEEAYETYKEMAVAGEQAGADLLVFETMTDLYEVKAAVLAAKENTSLPVWVTMSFEENGRTFTGALVSAMAATLDGLGVDAMGINCSLGPAEIFPLLEEMRAWTDKPLIVKPNAGLPDPATGAYAMDTAEFARQMAPFFTLGVAMAGGCCGTTPAFIRALRAVADEDAAAAAGDAVEDGDAAADNSAGTAAGCPAPEKRDGSRACGTCRRGVCSASRMVELDGRIHVIGERINPTGKKRFQQALLERDMNYIMERAIEQADAGAEILDINVGLPDIDEPAVMTEVVRAVQSVVALPLQIDSSDPAAIEAGLRACNGRAIVNSVNAEEETLDKILPIVKKYGAAVVGLAMDKSGIPETAEQRFALAERIAAAAEAYGIPRGDVLIDCLTLTISAQQEQAMETLRAVRMVREQLGLHCLLGVSNISFGLPRRIGITTSFLTQALQCGMDLPILNPNQLEVMDAVAAYRALSGEDEQCEAYIERFAGREEKSPAAPAAGAGPQDTSGAGAPKEAAGSGSAGGTGAPERTLEYAVLKGLKEEARSCTEELLQTMSELDVINERLIPALDEVGDRYERQEIFLPQLINAANAACAGFDLIKDRIAASGKETVSKGKIVIATVEGDIHDIGKNIVRVVLENYGYTVIDLGRDVPVQEVVDAAVREDTELVCLSALMTTTVSSMKKTIEALRASGHSCRVMVGGAVLTREYAEQIGADFYSKDAKEAADIAREVLG